MDATKIILTITSPFVLIQSAFSRSFFVKTIYNYMNQKGSGGTQVIDGKKKQDLEVQEPIVFLGYNINEESSFGVNFVSDSWTSASDTAFDDATGASFKDDQKRTSNTGSYTLAKKEYGFSISAGSSKEWDYESNNFSLGGYKTFADDNFTLGFTYSQFDDETKLYDVRADVTKPFQERLIRSYDISASQILTHTDIINFGWNHITQNGALEGTLNTVELDRVRIEEILPSSRIRDAYYTKWIHAFNDENALHLFYRYYQDTWASQAHTLQASYVKSLFDDEGIIEVFYRYYTQNDNKYFKESFDSEKDYMTSDADLSKLQSNQIGFLIERSFEGDLVDYSIVGGLSHYDRSNDLSYSTAQIGFKVEY